MRSGGVGGEEWGIGGDGEVCIACIHVLCTY